MSDRRGSDETGCWLLFLLWLILVQSCSIDSKLGQIRDELRAQQKGSVK